MSRRGLRSSPLLASGMCLVDTPGIGSVSLTAGDVTRDFVPHIDAALVVLGVDPPISGEELRLVEQVAAETDRFVFVLNKADKIIESELPEVLLFTRRVLLERLGRLPDDLFEVSALDRLRLGTPTRDWARLERALTNLAGAEKRELLDERRARADLGRDYRDRARLLERVSSAFGRRRGSISLPALPASC